MAIIDQLLNQVVKSISIRWKTAHRPSLPWLLGLYRPGSIHDDCRPAVYRQSVRHRSTTPVYGDDYYRYLATDDQLSAAPLHGVTVLDMSRVLAGPYCSMILGDMGAEVIKIEKPGTGDDTRSWGPPWVGDQSAYFLSINRNKKSVAVDISTKEGVKIVQELIHRSDVLIENYLPDKLARYGLDYRTVSRLRPSLVYCSITGGTLLPLLAAATRGMNDHQWLVRFIQRRLVNMQLTTMTKPIHYTELTASIQIHYTELTTSFGQSGPYVKRGGYDNIAIAIGGLMHITGPENGEPCRNGVALVDLSTGLYAVGAIVAALLQQKKTGKGQHIQCNLLSTQLALLSHIASNWLNCGIESKRWGTAHPSLVPYQAFTTKDGRYIMLGTGSDRQFQELSERLGNPGLALDEKYKTNNNRVANRGSLVGMLTSRFQEKTLDEWLMLFDGVSFPYGPVNTIKQAFCDPQVLHNQSVQEMTHPITGNIRLTGPAVTFSDTSNVLQYPPPLLGEHTQLILQEQLGYSRDKIEQLRRDGIVQCVDT